MDYVVVILLIVLIVRNIRKDKSDGRDYLGGSGGTRKDNGPLRTK